MMKNPAANTRSGKLLASVGLGRSAETNLMDLNGWSISTLLEGYCRESIKRPIGAITLTITVRLKWQGLNWCGREADSGAPKEQSLSLSVLDAA
jgi:hypothetical protein